MQNLCNLKRTNYYCTYIFFKSYHPIPRRDSSSSVAGMNIYFKIALENIRNRTKLMYIPPGVAPWLIGVNLVWLPDLGQFYKSVSAVFYRPKNSKRVK
jgi:hypothetical protein